MMSRSQPAIGWGHYREGLKEKGRPVEIAGGKGTPGPQYHLDRYYYKRTKADSDVYNKRSL